MSSKCQHYIPEDNEETDPCGRKASYGCNSANEEDQIEDGINNCPNDGALLEAVAATATGSDITTAHASCLLLLSFVDKTKRLIKFYEQ